MNASPWSHLSILIVFRTTVPIFDQEAPHLRTKPLANSCNWSMPNPVRQSGRDGTGSVAASRNVIPFTPKPPQRVGSLISTHGGLIRVSVSQCLYNISHVTAQRQCLCPFSASWLQGGGVIHGPMDPLLPVINIETIDLSPIGGGLRS